MTGCFFNAIVKPSSVETTQKLTCVGLD